MASRSALRGRRALGRAPALLCAFSGLLSACTANEGREQRRQTSVISLDAAIAGPDLDDLFDAALDALADAADDPNAPPPPPPFCGAAWAACGPNTVDCCDGLACHTIVELGGAFCVDSTNEDLVVCDVNQHLCANGGNENWCCSNGQVCGVNKDDCCSMLCGADQQCCAAGEQCQTNAMGHATCAQPNPGCNACAAGYTCVVLANGTVGCCAPGTYYDAPNNACVPFGSQHCGNGRYCPPGFYCCGDSCCPDQIAWRGRSFAPGCMPHAV